MNNIEFYEVKDANKTVISFEFDIDYKREDIIKKKMMQRMLMNYTNDLKNIKDYRSMEEKLYIMESKNRIISDIDRAIYNINFVIPKSDIIDDFNLDKAIKFMCDVLFNPFINNEQFDTNAFDSELNYLKDIEKDYPHNIGEYSFDTFLDFVDEENKTMIHHDEYINYLNTINNEKVYNYYLKNIKNNDFKICVFGNIEDKENVLNNLNKYFKSNKVEDKKLNYYEFLPILDYKEKEITTKYNQSVLSMLYQFRNITEEDIIKLEILYYFLNSKENNLLYTELRYKNNLIYQSAVKRYDNYGILDLVVFFDYKLLNKVEEAIYNIFKDLKNKDNYELYKERLIKAIEYDILDEEDNPFYIVNETFCKKYFPNDLLKVKLEKIKNISFESFLEFLNRMILTRKMIMKSGEKND